MQSVENAVGEPEYLNGLLLTVPSSSELAIGDCKAGVWTTVGISAFQLATISVCEQYEMSEWLSLESFQCKKAVNVRVFAYRFILQQLRLRVC
jgi:hypothetical protein